MMLLAKPGAALARLSGRRALTSPSRPLSSLRSLLPSARPEWPGHAAFILTGLSFASPSELSLRLLATSSCTFACLFNYYHPVGTTLWLPLRWNALYLALNAYYAAILLSEKFVTLRADEERMYQASFAHSMSPADFRRLAALGRECTVGSVEEEVITKGRANETLVLLLEGTGVIVLEHGVRIERHAGLFGEVSFLHGGGPSATVRLQPGSRYVVWSRSTTRDKLAPNAMRGLEHAISLEVTRHLSEATSRIVALSHPADGVRTQTWQDLQVRRLQRGGSVNK